ncbi:MAG: esterase family protein [Lachnospiraceae bacterium]|nr:esterase family protein [Lachnospiraceae bacterium]
MAIVECSFYSQALLGMTKMNVFLPTPDADCAQKGETKEHPFLRGERFPVLYLLHGMCEDYSTVLRKTRIESYAKKAGIAVVMPDGENSFYLNPKFGRKYETFIAQELPLFVKETLPVQGPGERCFIGGFSMGAYGALRLALKYPETFSKVMAFSGPYDVTELRAPEEGYFPMHPEALGGGDVQELAGTDADLYCVASALAGGDRPRPEIFLSCGTEDEYYETFVKTQAVFSDLGLAYTAQEAAGGHGWDYWDPALLSALGWLTEDEA